MTAPQPGPAQPRPPDLPRRRRGRVLALGTLLAVVGAAALLGVACYRALDAIDVVSADPVGVALGWAAVAGAVAVVALVLVLVALVAVAYCRPRGVAGLALAGALVLPAVAVAVSVPLGVDAARVNAAAALTAQGGVADSAVELLATLDVDAGPARDLLRAVLGAG